MPSAKRIIGITLISFLLFFVINRLYFGDLYRILFEKLGQKTIPYFISYIIVGFPIFIGLDILFRKRKVERLEALGLRSNIILGFLLSLLATLPMLIGYAWNFEWNAELNWGSVLRGALGAAFFEELYFRAFLFGVLYRYTRLGFFPSIILGAIIFGGVHVFQSSDPMTMLGIFFTTFMGAGLFAWLYVEWNYNLWVPIFLHLFMNLFWMMFAVDDNALGGVGANVFRIMTIALAITGTVIYKTRTEGLAVNKHTLWMKNKTESF